MKTLASITALAALSFGGLLADEATMSWGTISNAGTARAASQSCAIQFSLGQSWSGGATGEANGADGGFWYVIWTEEVPDGYIGVPWSWIAIPLHPTFPTPEDVLGYDCGGGLWRWDKCGKMPQVYRPPFVEWDLEVAESYMTYVDHVPDRPCYSGYVPVLPYEFKMGRMGWVWLSMPKLYELGYPDFMPSVKVRYPSDDTGTERTASEDRNAGDDAWVSWDWSFWDTALQAPKTFSPYAPFGNNVCHPWTGYRAWVNIGAAPDEDAPDQVTLIWP